MVVANQWLTIWCLMAFFGQIEGFWSNHLPGLGRHGRPTLLASPQEDIQMYRKTNNWQAALKRLDQAERNGEELTSAAFTDAMLCLNRGRRWKDSIGLFRKAQKLSLHLNCPIYNAVLHASARSRDWNNVSKLLAEMDSLGIEKDLASYNIGISAAANAKQLNAALALFKNLQANKGLKPNVQVYTSVVNAYGRGGDWRGALAALGAAEAAGLRPTTALCNAALSALAAAGRAAEALALYRQMGARGVDKDVVTFNQAITACSKNGQLDSVLLIYEEMEMQQPPIKADLSIYNALLTACGMADDDEMASKFFAEIKQKGIKPDARTYFGIITLFGRRGDFEKSKYYFEDMISNGVRPTPEVYRTFIIACGRLSKHETAASRNSRTAHVDKLVAAYQQEAPKGRALPPKALQVYLAAAEAYAFLGAYFDGQRFAASDKRELHLREVLADTIDVSALNQASKALVVFDDFLKTSTNRGIQQKAYNTMIKMYGAGKDFDKAMQMLENMLKQGIKADLDSYLGIILACCASGNSAEAIQLANSAESNGFTLTWKMLKKIIIACRQAEDASKIIPALIFFYEMSFNYQVPFDADMYSTLISTFAKGKELIKASGLLLEMHENGFNTPPELVCVALKCVCLYGPPDEAKDLFKEYVEWTEDPDIMVYNTMISSHTKKAQYEEALSYYKEARGKMAGKLDIVTYHSAISAALKDQNLELAQEIYAGMQKEGVNPDEKFTQTLLPIILESDFTEFIPTSAGNNPLNTIPKDISQLDGFFKRNETNKIQAQMPLSRIKEWLAFYSSSAKYEEALLLISKLQEEGIELDRESFEHAISACFRAKQYQKLEKVYKNMSARSIQPDGFIMGKVMASLILLGQEHEAMELFGDSAKDQDSYYSAVSAYSRASNPEKASQLFHEMVSYGIEPQLRFYESLIIGYGNSEQSEKAQHYFDKILADSLSPSLTALNGLMAAYEKTNNNSKVLFLYDSLRAQLGLQPNSWSNEIIMKVVCKSGDMASAQRLLEKFQATKVKPSLGVFKAMLSLAQQKGDFKGAVSLYDEMKKSSIEVDAGAYALIIRACTNGQQALKAYEFINEAKNKGMNVPIQVIDSFMFLCAKVGESKIALNTFESVKADGIELTEKSYLAALVACSRRYFVKESLAIMQEMMSKGLKLNLFAYNSLLLATSRAGRASLASGLLRRMQSENIPADITSYNAAIIAIQLAKKPSMEKAMKLLKEMNAKGIEPNEKTFASLLKLCTRSGEGGRAMEFLEKLRSIGVKPGSSAFESVIVAYAKEGNMLEANKLLKDFQNAGFLPTPKVYNAFLQALGNAKDSNSVVEILGQMKENNADIDIQGACAAIMAFSANNEVGAALDLLTSFQDLALELNINHYNSMIFSCIPNGQTQIAEAIFRMMKNASVEPNIVSFSGLIRAQTAAREWKSVETTLNDMTALNMTLPSKIYSSVLAACARGGVADLAVVLLKAKIEAKSQKLSHTDFLYASTAASRHGDVSLSIILLEQMEKMIGKSLDWKSYSVILAGCRKAQDHEQALHFYKKMKTSLASLPPFAVSDTISACAQAGALDDALVVLEDAYSQKVIPTTQTYRDLLHACTKSRNSLQALHIFNDMQEQKIEIDKNTLEHAILACASVQIQGDLQEGSGCGPGYMRGAHCKLGQKQTAETILEHFYSHDRQPKSWKIYSSMISLYYSKGGDSDIYTMVSVFEESIKENIWLPVSSYELIIQALGSRLLVQPCLKLFRALSNPSCQLPAKDMNSLAETAFHFFNETKINVVVVKGTKGFVGSNGPDAKEAANMPEQKLSVIQASSEAEQKQILKSLSHLHNILSAQITGFSE